MITPGHGQPVDGTSTPPSRVTGAPPSVGWVAGMDTGSSSTSTAGAEAGNASMARTTAIQRMPGERPRRNDLAVSVRAMKIRAAVLEEFAKPMVVQELDLAEP